MTPTQHSINAVTLWGDDSHTADEAVSDRIALPLELPAAACMIATETLSHSAAFAATVAWMHDTALAWGSIATTSQPRDAANAVNHPTCAPTSTNTPRGCFDLHRLRSASAMTHEATGTITPLRLRASM